MPEVAAVSPVWCSCSSCRAQRRRGELTDAETEAVGQGWSVDDEGRMCAPGAPGAVTAKEEEVYPMNEAVLIVPTISRLQPMVASPKATRAARKVRKKKVEEAKVRAEMRTEVYFRGHLTAFNMRWYPGYCRAIDYQRRDVARADLSPAEGAILLPARQTDPHTGSSRTQYVPLVEGYHFSTPRPMTDETEASYSARCCDAAITAWGNGVSFSHEACHCAQCRSRRAQAYRLMRADRHLQYESFLYDEMRSAGLDVDRPGRRGDSVLARRASRSQQRAPNAYAAESSARGGARRLVGVEVEYNQGADRVCRNWLDTWEGGNYHTDGSCGYEAVTPPMAGEHVEECLTELMHELREKGAGCDDRCGIHVHVDARDMRWVDMLRFLTVYSRVEPALFILGGQQRLTENRYCKPAGELFRKALQAPDVKGAILSAAVLSEGDGYIPAARAGRDRARAGVDKKDNGRYKSVNIIPWIAGRAYNRPDTTVEFRLHRGSHEGQRIVHWAWLCADIIDWCINASNEDVRRLPRSAMATLMVMSPRNKAWLLKRLLGWRKSTTATRPKPGYRGGAFDDAGRELPVRRIKLKGGVYRCAA